MHDLVVLPRRDIVLLGIDEAFHAATMPQTEEELAPPSIDAPYAIEHFLGKTRQDVESTSFPASLYMEDFTYMTEGAIAYYLPCVLRLMLAKPYDSELWIFLGGFLRSPDCRLTDAQNAAVAAWADHLAEAWIEDDWMSRFAEEAIELAANFR